MRPPVVRFLSRFRADETGATAIEYGVIIALLFLVILTSVTAFGNQATRIFNTAIFAIRDAIRDAG